MQIKDWSFSNKYNKPNDIVSLNLEMLIKELEVMKEKNVISIDVWCLKKAIVFMDSNDINNFTMLFGNDGVRSKK